MELSSVVSKDARTHRVFFSGFSDFRSMTNNLGGVRDFGFRRSASSYCGILRTGLCDRGHLQLQCYNLDGRPICGRKKTKEMEVNTPTKNKAKKKMKLLKDLCKDLAVFMEMGTKDVMDSDGGFVGGDQEKLNLEAAEILLKELQRLKAADKESKRKRKAERVKLKSKTMEPETGPGLISSGSSASSGSSNGKCLESRAIRTDQSLRSNAESGSVPSGRKIEVCLGNKCRKSGGEALLEEFQRVFGGAEAVVGCKCMKNCRAGPNVRILNCAADDQGEGDTKFNPMYSEVGMEDVGNIVSKLSGKENV